jgi:hypothetical protein
MNDYFKHHLFILSTFKLEVAVRSIRSNACGAFEGRIEDEGRKESIYLVF